MAKTVEAEFLEQYRERGGETLREERIRVEDELLADFGERHGEEAAGRGAREDPPAAGGPAGAARRLGDGQRPPG